MNRSVDGAHHTCDSWLCCSAVLAFVFGLAVIMVTQLANRPLWHTDLWDHVNYGQNILVNRQIPDSEPLLPTARNTPMVNTAWGSQVAMAFIVNSSFLGLPALQFIYGSLITVAIGIVGWAVVRKSGSIAFGMLAYLTFLLVNWQQFLIIRPQLIGVTLYAIILAMLQTDADRHRSARWILPCIFVVWANLHGSFAMGLLLMGLVAIGRFTDAFFSTHSLCRAASYRPFVVLLPTIAFCFVAAVLNPNGWRIYTEVLRVGRHPNIASMYEWAPLSLQMKQGQAFAAVVMLLLIAMIFTPRKRRATEWIPLIVNAAMTMWSARMINWFAPVAAYVLCLHGDAIAGRIVFHKATASSSCSHKALRWSRTCIVIACGSFFFTPLGQQAISGRTLPLRALVSKQTPVETADFLASMKDAPSGLVFYPAEWSGFLTHFGATTVQPMVNLHVHVISQQVWTDYLHLNSGAPGCSAVLDRYNINLVVVDKNRHGRLAKHLLNDNSWTLSYDDVQAVVFVRRARAAVN